MKFSNATKCLLTKSMLYENQHEQSHNINEVQKTTKITI